MASIFLLSPEHLGQMPLLRTTARFVCLSALAGAFRIMPVICGESSTRHLNESNDTDLWSEADTHTRPLPAARRVIPSTNKSFRRQPLSLRILNNNNNNNDSSHNDNNTVIIMTVIMTIFPEENHAINKSDTSKQNHGMFRNVTPD